MKLKKAERKLINIKLKSSGLKLFISLILAFISFILIASKTVSLELNAQIQNQQEIVSSTPQISTEIAQSQIEPLLDISTNIPTPRTLTVEESEPEIFSIDTKEADSIIESSENLLDYTINIADVYFCGDSICSGFALYNKIDKSKVLYKGGIAVSQIFEFD